MNVSVQRGPTPAAEVVDASTPTVVTVSSRRDWAEVAAILHDHAEWMRTAGGFDPLRAQPAFAAELAHPDAHYAGDHAVMLLGRVGGVAAGTAAVRFHGDGTAELKRMYVRPIARGTGLADRLLLAALDLATDRGSQLVWLETKRGVMDRAIALYRRHGFEEVSSGPRTFDLEGVIVMERPTHPRRVAGRQDLAARRPLISDATDQSQLDVGMAIRPRHAFAAG